MRWRWPSGFVCPVCAGASQLRQDPGALPVYRLSAAESVIAGTIFAQPRCRCALGFASCTISSEQGGISSIELGRRLGVTQTIAWKIKHKLMQAMMERDATKCLTGRIEIDDAYLGCEHNGGK